MKKRQEKKIEDLTEIETAFKLGACYADFYSDELDNCGKILDEMKRLIVHEPTLIALLDRDMAERIFID